MQSLKLGTLLHGGKYRIEYILGQGTFGITYLATTKLTIMGELGQMDTIVNVAIKEFYMRDINGRDGDIVTSENKGGLFDDYKNRFKTEALNLSKLQHPNIVKIIESFEANNTVYYVMEYIDGGSLDEYIKEKNRLKEDEAIWITKQIGAALSYMHTQGMLHLDVKPSNIMRTKGDEVVLIDFGLSKQYDPKGESETCIEFGAGTSGYAPIEQANYRVGKEFPVTIDIYALGATLFKMLTGVCPPNAWDILNDGFPFYELETLGINDYISRCVANAMAPYEKDRTKSVSAFINSLNDPSAFEKTKFSKDKQGSTKHQREVTIYNEFYTSTNKQQNNPNVSDVETSRTLFFLTPQKDTGKVRLEYYPSFHSGKDGNIYEITNHHVKCQYEHNQVLINQKSEKTWRMYDISQDAFKNFLTELKQLKIMFIPKEFGNEEYGTDNTRIKIILYNKNNQEYQTLWKYLWWDEYGGGENGNMTETPEDIYEKIMNILPREKQIVYNTEVENSFSVRGEDLQAKPEIEKSGCLVTLFGLSGIVLHAIYPLIWLWTLLSKKIKYPDLGFLLLIWFVGVLISVVAISNKKDNNMEVFIMWLLLIVETIIVYFINYF